MSFSTTRPRRLAPKPRAWRLVKPLAATLIITILALCLVPLFVGGISTAKNPSKQDDANQPTELARLSETVSVRAAGRGNPTINLTDGHDILTSYASQGELQIALGQNRAQPRSLASADFDEDGVPDLVSGYEHLGSGIVTVLRGNVDAIYPNGPEADQRRKNGTFTAAPFLSPAQVFGVPIAADFIGAGDFDGDSHWDVVAASRTSNDLTLLSGYGNGSFKAPREIPLPGLVTAMTTNEINRRDGLTDLVIGLDGPDGPQVLVFEGPTGALQTPPEVFMMPAPVKALALGQLDDRYEIDLAVAAGRELVIIHGRDPQLLLDPEMRVGVKPVRREQRAFPFAINSLVLGDFKAKHQTEIALLFDDGSLQLMSRKTGSKAKQVAEQSIASWQSHELAGGDWAATMLLGSAKVSSLPGDELLVVDAPSGRLHIMRPGQPQTEGVAKNGSAKTKLQPELASLESAGGAPVAVVPMRLNADALSDLTVLTSGKSTPTTISTTAAMTFIVTNTNDSGPGSLRQAVTASNANPGADTINFEIGSGVQTIMVQSFLPNIIDPVTIDAFTQPGYAGQPLIELNGVNNTIDFPAFSIYAGNTTVRGFVINRFHSDGLGLLTNPGNIIEGNYIGTDVTGRIALPNDFRGIGIGGDGRNSQPSSNNRIGGTTPQARNVISGNKVHGVRILGLASTGNVVQGNYIGTDVTGTVGLGNNFEGVYVGGGLNNTVGGTQPGAGNVISSNGTSGSVRTASGVHIGTFPFLTGASGNIVQGNRVGTNASGTAALGNAHEGVVLEDGASSNTVGGTTTVARNIISGNGTNGVDLGFSKQVTLNQVLGNYIGTDVTGDKLLSNDLYGIFINVNSVNNMIRDNRIAFNSAGGIFIPNTTPDPGDPGIRIAIDFNDIFANGGLGIDLGSLGITPNDPLDPDGGANLQQNFPVLTSVTQQSNLRDAYVSNTPLTAINVNGTLNSTPNTPFIVHWYFSNDAMCSNNQAGSRPLVTGRIPGVTTDGSGNAPFTIPFNFPAGTMNGVINCTATDLNGNTSEFSSCFPVMAPPARTLTVASANPSSGVSITVSPNDNGAQGNGTTQFTRTYNLNANVNLTAPATAGGNNFQKWLKDGVDFANNQLTNVSVTMDGNHTMTAVYVTPTRTLTVASTNPSSGVSITVSPNDNAAQGNGATQFTRTYNNSTVVSLTAPATTGGNNFQKWLKDGADFTNNQLASVSVTMDANHTMTAVYVTPIRTLTVASNPGSGVSITVSPNDNNSAGNGSTEFTRLYNNNTVVSLTAPGTAGGNNFQKWLKDGADFANNQLTNVSVTMDANHTMTAVYLTPTRTLTVASTNPSSGVSITVSPNDNGAQGSGTTQFTRTYNNNTVVSLTAPATTPGNNFQKWQRDGVDFATTQATMVTMDANHTLTAIYVTPQPTQHFLTMSAGDDTRGGTVSPASGFYNNGESVNIRATANLGYRFSGWTGSGAGSFTGATSDASVSMNGPITETASFTAVFNPLEDLGYFVNQHYRDFLDRDPDAGGLNHWSSQIRGCGTDANCIRRQRIGVSAAFFVEQEFQRTGSVVYRMYRAAYGTLPNTTTRANITFAQFIADRALLPEGSDIAQTTISFANAFVQRSAFLTAYPASLTNAQFVNQLFDTAGLTPYTTERQQQIDAMTNNGKTRAQVLLDVIEIAEFKTREYNRSFVLMQYFGYLRRDPEPEGYNFWLKILNNPSVSNIRSMVCAFLTSREYQERFSTIVPRNDGDCADIN